MRSVDRLNSLVRDLMDTARLEQGLFALNPVPVDLVELVSQTSADSGTSTTSVDIRGDADELVVLADPNRLRQVLENLLSNAFKVQPPQVPVVISLAVCDAWAIVTIADHGPGVPAEVRPRLFELFAAGASSTGLGVGCTWHVASPRRTVVRSKWSPHPATEHASSSGSRLRVSPSRPAWCRPTEASRP